MDILDLIRAEAYLWKLEVIFCITVAIIRMIFSSIVDAYAYNRDQCEAPSAWKLFLPFLLVHFEPLSPQKGKNNFARTISPISQLLLQKMSSNNILIRSRVAEF